MDGTPVLRPLTTTRTASAGSGHEPGHDRGRASSWRSRAPPRARTFEPRRAARTGSWSTGEKRRSGEIFELQKAGARRAEVTRLLLAYRATPRSWRRAGPADRRAHGGALARRLAVDDAGRPARGRRGPARPSLRERGQEGRSAGPSTRGTLDPRGRLRALSVDAPRWSRRGVHSARYAGDPRGAISRRTTRSCSRSPGRTSRTRTAWRRTSSAPWPSPAPARARSAHVET